MTSVSSRPVARLTTPGEIVATVPLLCGYPPSDSVVVLSLRGPRRRLGLTIRLDRPPPGLAEEAAELLVERVVHDGGRAAVVVVYAGARDEPLAAAVTAACERRGVEVAEALHVADGRWTSYACMRSCCPAEGTPVTAAPGLVEAQQALEGRAVLGSRAELVRSLAAADGPLDRARVEQEGQRWLALRQADGVAAARRSALAAARLLLAWVADGGTVDDDAAAALAVALHDVHVRDEIVTWGTSSADALLSLSEQVARRTPAPHDAPVCTLLAWTAYAKGDGGWANVALDRALATDPAYSLALLLRQALDSGLPPERVRRTMSAARRAIRSGPSRR